MLINAVIFANKWNPFHILKVKRIIPLNKLQSCTCLTRVFDVEQEIGTEQQRQCLPERRNVRVDQNTIDAEHVLAGPHAVNSYKNIYHVVNHSPKCLCL